MLDREGARGEGTPHNRILAEFDFLALEFGTLEFSDGIGEVIGGFKVNDPGYQIRLGKETYPLPLRSTSA
jgi:hypothetical protein